MYFYQTSSQQLLTIRRGAVDDSWLQVGQVFATLDGWGQERTGASRRDGLARRPWRCCVSPMLLRATPARRPPACEETACTLHVRLTVPSLPTGTSPRLASHDVPHTLLCCLINQKWQLKTRHCYLKTARDDTYCDFHWFQSFLLINAKKRSFKNKVIHNA